MALLVVTAQLGVVARSRVCRHIHHQVGVQVSMLACRPGLGLHVRPCPCSRECWGLCFAAVAPLTDTLYLQQAPLLYDCSDSCAAAQGSTGQSVCTLDHKAFHQNPCVAAHQGYLLE